MFPLENPPENPHAAARNTIMKQKNSADESWIFLRTPEDARREFFFTPNTTNFCRIFQKKFEYYLAGTTIKIYYQQNFFFLSRGKRDPDIRSESYVEYDD